jgi:hypothetical protein
MNILLEMFERLIIIDNLNFFVQYNGLPITRRPACPPLAGHTTFLSG